MAIAAMSILKKWLSMMSLIRMAISPAGIRRSFAAALTLLQENDIDDDPVAMVTYLHNEIA